MIVPHAAGVVGSKPFYPFIAPAMDESTTGAASVPVVAITPTSLPSAGSAGSNSTLIHTRSISHYLYRG